MKQDPVILSRREQAYMGKRAVLPMSAFQVEIPAMTARVVEWLRSHKISASGSPFLRYHVIDMPERMDVELGIPVDNTTESDAEIKAGTLPEGRYAVLTYVGVGNGVQANSRLVEWIEQRGEEPVSQDSDHGQVFEARFETFLSEPTGDDPESGQVEVAIKLRD